MTAHRRHILFVCTGNICRSPIAEYLLRHHMGPKISWQVRSAGLTAVNGLAASQPAIEALSELGVDLTPHRSHSVTKEMIDSATLIVVMTTFHALELKQRFPEAQDRIYLLKSFQPSSKGGDIPDPIGGEIHTYRTIRDEIDEALLDLILYLKQHEAWR